MKKQGILLVLVFLLTISFAAAGTVTRSFNPATAVPGGTVEVTLDVTPVKGDTVLVIDEAVPAGWTVRDAGSGEIVKSGHLVWTILQGLTLSAYKYTVSVPATASAGDFYGEYQFDTGVATSIAGATHLTVGAVAEEIPPEAGASADDTPATKAELLERIAGLPAKGPGGLQRLKLISKFLKKKIADREAFRAKETAQEIGAQEAPQEGAIQEAPTGSKLLPLRR